MTENPYPGIGFDPAPGSLADIDALVQRLSTARDGVDEARALLHRLRHSSSEVWHGAAGEAFRATLDATLGADLAQAADAVARAADALESWRSGLLAHQTTAATLEAEAARARSEHRGGALDAIRQRAHELAAEHAALARRAVAEFDSAAQDFVPGVVEVGVPVVQLRAPDAAGVQAWLRAVSAAAAELARTPIDPVPGPEIPGGADAGASLGDFFATFTEPAPDGPVREFPAGGPA